MDIYPEDLELAYRVQVQQVRRLVDGTLAGGSQYGFLGSMCGMAPAILLNSWLHLIPSMFGDFFFAGGVGAALGYACGLLAERNHISKQPGKKVTTQEIALVSKSEGDPLRMEYLGLISTLVSMKPSQDTSVEAIFRSAIRDIGAGVEKLPGQPAEDLLRDAEAFTKEAMRLATEATQEGDAVVAASLLRQSAAQNQRAEAVSQNAALARRNQALRHEMRGHIQALKTMIGASALGDSNDGYDLTALAQNVQQVAIEARSLTEAKQELAVALGVGHGARNSITPEQPELHHLNG